MPRRDTPGVAASDGAELPPGPRSLALAFRATIAWATINLLSAASLFLSKPFLHRYFVKLNNEAKVKKANFTGSTIDRYVNNFLITTVVISILTGAIAVLLAALAMRGKSWARWALLVLATGLLSVVCNPLQIGAVYHLIGIAVPFPVTARVLQGFALVGSILVIVLLMRRDTRAFFEALRPQSGDGAARPTLFEAFSRQGRQNAQQARRDQAARRSTRGARATTEPGVPYGESATAKPTPGAGSTTRRAKAKSRREPTTEE